MNSSDGTPRLLILDDDDSVAMTLAAIASSSGFAVRTCNEPDEFFDAVRDWHPSHITVDMVMPSIGGEEVLHRLAEQHCDAHVIISSGLDKDELAVALRAAEDEGLTLVGVLSKPFRPKDVRALLSG